MVIEQQSFEADPSCLCFGLDAITMARLWGAMTMARLWGARLKLNLLLARAGGCR